MGSRWAARPVRPPVSVPTKRRIIAWLNAYDNEYRWEVAPWQPHEGAEGDADEAAWVEEGETIRAIIQDELGPGYEVVFET